jgi:Flp pilus assembly protein TadG
MRSSRERGAASVEFAIVLPVVVVALLLLVQVALLVSWQLDVAHAAREGARALAVTNDDAQARKTALAAGQLDSSRTEVAVSPLPSGRGVGDLVTVTVQYRPQIVMPYITDFLPSGIVLSASVAERLEKGS